MCVCVSDTLMLLIPIDAQRLVVVTYCLVLFCVDIGVNWDVSRFFRSGPKVHRGGERGYKNG